MATTSFSTLFNLFGKYPLEKYELDGGTTTSEAVSIDSIFDNHLNDGSTHVFAYHINGYITDVTGINTSFGFGFMNSTGKYSWVLWFGFSRYIHWFVRNNAATYTHYKLNNEAVT